MLRGSGRNVLRPGRNVLYNRNHRSMFKDSGRNVLRSGRNVRMFGRDVEKMRKLPRSGFGPNVFRSGRNVLRSGRGCGRGAGRVWANRINKSNKTNSTSKQNRMSVLLR